MNALSELDRICTENGLAYSVDHPKNCDYKITIKKDEKIVAIGAGKTFESAFTTLKNEYLKFL